MTDSPLILAVPSKGRLQENAAAFFARAGLVFTQSRGARDYRGTIAGLPGVEVAFLSASEIVNQLADIQPRWVEHPVEISYTDYSKSKGQSLLNGVNILTELFVK